ncbi:MAG: hypothetical protein H7A54_04425 [Akkermansiaceae bacterium]|nr:hypothetical protein [Akkermansiaceae bacterium]
MFGLPIAAAGLVALLEISLLGAWLPGLQSCGWLAPRFVHRKSRRKMGACFAVAAFYVVFVPTLLLGAAFPAH